MIPSRLFIQASFMKEISISAYWHIRPNELRPNDPFDSMYFGLMYFSLMTWYHWDLQVLPKPLKRPRDPLKRPRQTPGTILNPLRPHETPWDTRFRTPENSETTETLLTPRGTPRNSPRPLEMPLKPPSGPEIAQNSPGTPWSAPRKILEPSETPWDILKPPQTP